jgi:hypothetical protein
MQVLLPVFVCGHWRHLIFCVLLKVWLGRVLQGKVSWLVGLLVKCHVHIKGSRRRASIGPGCAMTC